MKFQNITLAALAFFSSNSHSAFQEREYNTWYTKDAVLYDMTQTSDGLPVMVSISQPGRSSANMVISYMSAGQCGEGVQKLSVNGKNIPAKYRCVQAGKSRIEHFAVKDAGCVNDIVNHLRSDFTLLLQNDIRVWAANFRTPKYGLAPRF
ncbi:hypothetical protein [Enterobacter ludwigii]|uniref:hypothetical protein n=1 Tax=Enterobacter ludwigii TaxID=299767 RepID=UPI003EF26FD7